MQGAAINSCDSQYDLDFSCSWPRPIRTARLQLFVAATTLFVVKTPTTTSISRRTTTGTTAHACSAVFEVAPPSADMAECRTDPMPHVTQRAD